MSQRGYKVKKLEDQIAWEVEQPNSDRWLLLTFIPRPVDQWRVLPSSTRDQDSEIYAIIEQAIADGRS
ncbi:hypothetical protein C7B61_16490 [filamentous cyanobacterium CCP1]|nr:hypothetical protein C7B76_01940 [filamentous cyanobacterium CCP2]PSB61067.1 hypothetical protein C7B61_16490 [filamentous cyanobacterium CCP1]